MTMPNSTPPADPQTTPSSADPLLLDSDQIEALADPATVRSALRHCNEQRVVALDRSAEGLFACVEDADSEEKLDVEVTRDDAGRLLGGCDCEAGADGALCVHGIAALFAYAKGQGQAPT
ncbi:MAG: helicase, partial [Thiohalocapsa sp.]